MRMFGRDLADSVLRLQQTQHGHDDTRACRHADHLHDLLLPRRRAHHMARFQILQIISPHRGRTTDHRANQQRRGGSRWVVISHQQGEDDGRESDRGDRDA